MKLLDPKTGEGRLYRAYSHLVFNNESFTPDQEKLPKIRDLILFVLDLEEVPHPLYAPFLKQARIKPGDAVKRPGTPRKEDGMFLLLPMEGLGIPRRFDKVRASQEISTFLDDRSEKYWKDVLDFLKWVVETSVRGWKDGVDKKILEEFYGESSMGLVKALRYPLLQLSRSFGGRRSALTKDEEAAAKRLFKKWYPLVQKFLKVRVSGRTPSGYSERFIELFNQAYPRITQAQPITLHMVSGELRLTICIDTLL